MPSWFPRFRRKAAAKPVTVSDLNAGIFSPTFGTPPKRGTRELIEAYKQAPWLRAALARIAMAVAGVEWRLYARSERAGPEKLWHPGKDKAIRDSHLIHGSKLSRVQRLKDLRTDGTLREIADHPMLDLLYRPNALMTGRSALQVSQVWHDLKGEAYWYLQRNEAGMPVGYMPIPPHWVNETPSQDRPYYRVTIHNQQFTIPQSEIVALRELDPSNPYGRGTGAAESLGDEIETDEYAAKFLKNWFYNSATPGLLVSVEGASEKEVRAAQERWEQDLRGVGNAHRIRFVTSKMNAIRLDSSFREQQIPELRKNQRDFLRQVFGIPPEVMGIIENSNRATIQAAFFMFAQGVLVPRLEYLRCELQASLVPQFDDRLILDYVDPTPENREFQLEVVKAAPYAFSLNEVRAMAALEPVPEFVGVYPPLAMPGQSPESGADKPSDPPTDPEGKQLGFRASGDPRSDPQWVNSLLRNAKSG